MSQYSIGNHTLLNLVLRVGRGKTLTYFLKDPQTKSLMMVNPAAEEELEDDVEAIQRQTKTKLTHIISNTPLQLPKPRPHLTLINPSTTGELKPIVVGELSICLINAHGYHPAYSLIGVTHMTPTSTKIPILFVHDLMGVCTINMEKDISSKDYCRSLDKVKYFPHETYIFPSKKANQEDLVFAKAVGVGSVIEQKLALFEKTKQLVDVLLPTTVGEQKMLNPFLAADKFSSLLGTNDRHKCFDLLKRTRKEWTK